MERKQEAIQTPAIPSRQSQPKSLVCPDDNTIPRIFLNLSEEKVSVEIHCNEKGNHKTRLTYQEYSKIWEDKRPRLKDQKCSLILKHIEDKAEGYCIICKEWVCKPCVESHEKISLKDKSFNHWIIKEDAIMMNVKPLSKEDSSINNYWHCLECNENWCKKCKTSEEHKNHKIIDTTETLSTKDVDTLIQNYKDFEAKYFTQLLENKTKWIQHITKWYEYNYRINSDLFDYVNSQLYMYQLLKETNNYNLWCNLKDICIHINYSIRYYDERLKLEENTNKIIEFFQNNFIFDIQKKPFKCTGTIQCESPVRSWCKLTHDEFAVGLGNGEIKIIEYSSSKVQRLLKGHTQAVWRWYLHKNKNYLISLSLDKTLHIWNHSLGEMIEVLREHSGPVYGIAEEENGNIITCSGDKSLKFWDINSFKCSKTIVDAHSAVILDVCIWKDRRWVSCGNDKMLKVWKDNINSKDDFSKSIPHNSNVKSLLQWEDSRLVVGTKGDIIIYDVMNDFKWQVELKGHTDRVYIWIELTNGFLASGSCYDSVMIWNWTNLKCEQVLKEHTADITTGWIELGRNVIMSGGDDKVVKKCERK